MKNRFLNISKLALAILVLCTQANADSFLVQDQQGLPLKNVVLEFTVNSASTSLVSGPKTLIMDQVDKLFKPDVLVIHQGDFVDFPNSDNIRHHVYSFSSVNPFELKLYSGRPEAPLQFNNAGVAVLGCNIHDSMVGYIYIATSKYVLMTDEQGLATLDNTVKYESVNVWHASALTSIKNITYDDITKKANDNALFVIDLVVQSPEPRNTFQSIFNQNGE
ncbi:methylamine utilization protein [Cognaticolwellia beringensis]|uniref:Methylamine utilization protein n=1 Tax=Cognaticolwellia beringensis TaxID=1967665 RepID=A0A222GCU6_9GAMM|nr:methylamine utilization protein [Cognaticolwellia beringensis]ASP49680.1 methylamine utilization protein [Cognaticolwellia beringensis]